MDTSVEALRRIADKCKAGQPLDRQTADWLGTAIESFLKRQVDSIEAALGLEAGRGGMPWWRVDANRHRDAALRELAQRFYAEGTICARARDIERFTQRYAETAWRFDRDREEMPESYSGTAKEYVWRAFRSGATMPIGERQLRNILRED
ncbi:MAG: hypothetical protein R3316_06835 [Rhodovibrionaceae bacterium]|nr:hypothetical protein [Rhodovibrionaceae bacterium]